MSPPEKEAVSRKITQLGIGMPSAQTRASSDLNSPAPPPAFVHVGNSVEFHHQRLTGTLPHHPSVRPMDAADDPSAASLMGRRELNQANANPALNRHVGWRDESAISESPAPLSPAPSDRLLDHYSDMLRDSAPRPLTPLTPDPWVNKHDPPLACAEDELRDQSSHSGIQIERQNSTSGSHESINLALLHSLLSPPGSPPPTSRADLDLERTPRNYFGDQAGTEQLMHPFPPGVLGLEEPPANQNRAPVLTTMYAYTNTAYHKAKDLFTSFVSPGGGEVPPEGQGQEVTGGLMLDRGRAQLPLTENYGDQVGEVKECQIQSFPLPPAEELYYDTDDDTWEPPRGQLEPIRLEELPTPDAAFLTCHYPPDLHPYLAKRCKKDCRMWLWKNTIGKNALAAIQKKSREIQNSLSIQSTGENANRVKAPDQSQRFL